MSIEYQGKSIGRELVERVKEIYKDYLLVDVGSFFTQRPFFDAPSQA